MLTKKDNEEIARIDAERSKLMFPADDEIVVIVTGQSNIAWVGKSPEKRIADGIERLVQVWENKL